MTPRREEIDTEVTQRTVGLIQLCGAYSLTKNQHSGVISPVWTAHKRTGYHSKYYFFSAQIGERSEKGNYTIIIRELENKTHDIISRLVVPKRVVQKQLFSTDGYER